MQLQFEEVRRLNGFIFIWDIYWCCLVESRILGVIIVVAGERFKYRGEQYGTHNACVFAERIAYYRPNLFSDRSPAYGSYRNIWD